MDVKLRSLMRNAGCSYELTQKVRELIKDERVDWNEFYSITQDEVCVRLFDGFEITIRE